MTRPAVTRTGVVRFLGAAALVPVAVSQVVMWPLVAHLCAVTGAAGLAIRRRPERPAGPSRTRFTVLVPAHDEELLVGETVRSLLAAGHPARLVEVIVVADHCRDRTVDVARAAGASVWEHDDPEPAGKAAALRWALERLPRAPVGDPTPARGDVVVFVDADSVVEPRFFDGLDDRLTRGAPVVQAHYAVRDEGDGTTVRLRAAALALRHLIRPLGRVTLGGSSGLFGNGMAFDRGVLDAHRWADHLTEDAELQVRLLLAGVPVDFAPDSVVRAYMPATLDASRTQHERWERGRIELARWSVPALVTAAARARGRRRRVLLDGALDQATPPLSVLVAVAVAGATWAWTVSLVAPSRFARFTRTGSTATLVGVAMHVLVGLRLAGGGPATYRALAHAPRLAAWKLGLWTRMLVADEVAWVRTPRHRCDGTGDRAGGVTGAGVPADVSAEVAT